MSLIFICKLSLYEACLTQGSVNHTWYIDIHRYPVLSCDPDAAYDEAG